MRNAFAPILRARPCPIFGRPVRLRGRPHRLQPDTSPHALRIPDRSGHPALRDISSSWLQVRLGRVRLSPSCPFRLLHTRLLSRPARRYPRFRIRPSSSERRGDFNPLTRCPAHTTRLVRLLACSTAASAPRLPATARIATATAGQTRSPRFQRDPFVRDVASDPGRATAPCMTAPHMLPSTPLTVSAPAK